VATLGTDIIGQVIAAMFMQVLIELVRRLSIGIGYVKRFSKIIYPFYNLDRTI